METIRRECVESQARADQARLKAARRAFVRAWIFFMVTVFLLVAIAMVLIARYL